MTVLERPVDAREKRTLTSVSDLEFGFARWRGNSEVVMKARTIGCSGEIAKKNGTHFRLNELLFDISVCSVDATTSFQRKAQSLEYISRCHW